MISYSIIIAIVYVLFLYKLVSVTYNELPVIERTQKTYQLLIILAIIGIIIPKLIDASKYKSSAEGIVLGSTILLPMTIIFYWNHITEDWKVLLLGFLLGYVIIKKPLK